MAEIVIDNIIEEKGTATVILWLRQPEPWDTPDLMAKLQNQLNGYISTIRDGLLVEKFPQYQGKKFRISLVCYNYPPDEVKLKLDRVNNMLLQMGIEFGIVLIKVETPQERREKLKKCASTFLNRLRGKS